MRSAPAVIGETQPIIRIVEVLPAPFGPRKPKDSPGATSKSTASTAVNSPKRLVRPRAWMSEGVDGAPGAGTADDTDVSDMGSHGTARAARAEWTEPIPGGPGPGRRPARTPRRAPGKRATAK